jgi:hypothetical protein
MGYIWRNKHFGISFKLWQTFSNLIFISNKVKVFKLGKYFFVKSATFHERDDLLSLFWCNKIIC